MISRAQLYKTEWGWHFVFTPIMMFKFNIGWVGTLYLRNLYTKLYLELNQNQCDVRISFYAREQLIGIAVYRRALGAVTFQLSFKFLCRSKRLENEIFGPKFATSKIRSSGFSHSLRGPTYIAMCSSWALSQFIIRTSGDEFSRCTFVIKFLYFLVPKFHLVFIYVNIKLWMSRGAWNFVR